MYSECFYYGRPETFTIYIQEYKAVCPGHLYHDRPETFTILENRVRLYLECPIVGEASKNLT